LKVKQGFATHVFTWGGLQRKCLPQSFSNHAFVPAHHHHIITRPAPGEVRTLDANVVGNTNQATDENGMPIPRNWHMLSFGGDTAGMVIGL
jgi:hypothetical protein